MLVNILEERQVRLQREEIKMTEQNRIKLRKIKRAKRVRGKQLESKARPRLSVFRSNRNFYAQIIDDKKAETVAAANGKEVGDAKETKSVKTAEKIGELIAKKAKDKKVKKVVFDKGAYKYHGRVKVFAEAARKGGLEF